MTSKTEPIVPPAVNDRRQSCETTTVDPPTDDDDVLQGMMSQVCGLFSPIEELFGNNNNNNKSKIDDDDDDDDDKTVKVRIAPPVILEKDHTDNNDDDDDVLISPFLRYEGDGYVWPSLYDEIDAAIERNVLIYAIAELRELARDNDQSILLGQQSLQLPITHAQLMDVVEANQEALENKDFGKGYVVDVLRTAEERNMMIVPTDQQPQPNQQQRRNVSPETIIAFDDEFATEELVYMIEVSERRRTVTITFRGSVTKADWATNFELYLTEVENPMKYHATQSNTVKIHNGFYNYMFQPNLRGVRGPNGEPLSEFTEIFQEHLLQVLEKYPGFKLVVTGHSLGGALATVFAFGAAALDDDIAPKPVTLITIAAPYVGDESFASSFQLMESLGRLRCCRVVNQRDIVTCVPKVAFRWKFLDTKSHVGTLFKHVGMAIRLFDGDDKPFEIIYRRKRDGWYSSLWDEMARGWDQTLFTQFDWNLGHYATWPWHKLRSYNERIQSQKEELQKLKLNDLYASPQHVGRLVPQF